MGKEARSIATVAEADVLSRREVKRAITTLDDSFDPARQFEMLAALTGDGVILHDGQSIMFVNAAALRVIGASPTSDVVGEPVARFLRDTDRAAIDACRAVLLSGAEDFSEVVLDLRGLRGQSVRVTAIVSLVTWQRRGAVQVVLRPLADFGVATTTTDARQYIEEAVSEAIVCTDTAFVIQSWNRAAEALYGWNASEVVGKPFAAVAGDSGWRVEASAAMVELFTTGRWMGEVSQRHRDGALIKVQAVVSLLRDADGMVVGVVSVNKATDLATSVGSDRDRLTGLSSRDRLLESLAAGVGSPSAVVILDVDRFGLLNSRCGEMVGDRVLIELARRLQEHARPDDLVSRVSGDRFAVHARVSSEDELRRLAQRIADRIDDPLIIDGSEVSVSVSLGAAWGCGKDEPLTLFEWAERALREAQGRGGHQLWIHDAERDLGDWDDDDAFVDEVRRGIENGEFSVVYQPIVDIRTKTLRKLEALARWRHPLRGDIPPLKFVPWAERTGVIEELGRWVMTTACREMVAAGDRLAGVALAVNVSVVQVRDEDFTRSVCEIVDACGLDRQRLWIEVTESVLVDSATILPLLELSEAGFRLVIDDFGTGFSSLQYLSRLPINALKVDRGFVAGLGVDARDTAIVRSVINLSSELGVQVIAEGVETSDQAAHLLALNCAFGQGWLFGRPAPLDRWHVGAAAPAAPISAALASVPRIEEEEQRLAVLTQCNIMDTVGEQSFDGLATMAAEMLGAPMALVSFVDADRQWFKARVGVEATETPRDLAFCAHAIARPQEVLVVADTLLDSRFAANPLVTGSPHIRFYAGAPVRSREQHALGTLCVLDTQPRTLTLQQIAVLRMLADQVGTLLEMRRQIGELRLVME